MSTKKLPDLPYLAVGHKTDPREGPASYLQGRNAAQRGHKESRQTGLKGFPILSISIGSDPMIFYLVVYTLLNVSIKMDNFLYIQVK